MKKGYRENERSKSSNLIQNTNLFDGAESGRNKKDEILLDGIYNIYEPIRNDVIEYFVRNDISFWHAPHEPRCKPTGHTLSSQVCCINHLFPIRHDEKTVLSIANLFCQGIKEVFPIKTDKYSQGYIQFESITDKNYLNEKQTTRGSNCTSVDALIYGKHDNGKRIIIPIEWKYIEYYADTDKSTENRKGEAKETEGKGKERLKRYSELIDNSQYLQNSQYLSGLSNYRKSVYFFEPFYQLMRQTLWAEQMIKHNKTETIQADDYIHIHIIPNMNDKLLGKYKLGKDKPDGRNMEEIWRSCLKNTEKYKIIDPKDLLKVLDNQKYGDLRKYLNERYWNNGEYPT